MTHIDLGTVGSKVGTWRSGPREMLRRITEKVGADNKDEIVEQFTAAITKPRNTGDLASIIEWWVTNNLRALQPNSYVPQKRDAATVAEVSKIKTKFRNQVRRQTRLALLNFKLPNGKKLRDCTGEECKNLGRTVGRWLGLIAAKVDPLKKVGNVLDEKQVREIYDSFN